MSIPSKNKKKLPWARISIIVLILAAISGIYFYKTAAIDKDNEAAKGEATAQITESSIQINTENNSGSPEPSEQTSIVQDTVETSSADQNSQQAKDSLPKLVDLGSNTCIPCQEMAPILEELKKEYSDRVIVEVVDVYENQEKMLEYNEIHPLSVIPTQILFDAKGNEVWSHEGYIPKEDIIKVFKEKVGVE